jgi:hypothetical protein
VATTSSGPSRRPSPWFVSAAVLAAAALHGTADPYLGPAAGSRLRPVANSIPIISSAAPAPAVDVNPLRSTATSAESIERALLDAAPAARDAILERMLESWVVRDAPAAARFAELQGDQFLHEVGLRTVARRWTRVDPKAAARWAVAIGDPAARRQVVDQVALVVADSDPRTALDLLAGSGEVADSADALAGVILSWARRDFAAAKSWVEVQPAGQRRDALVQRLAFMRAQTDPGMAMQFASELLGDENARRDAYASIIRPWAERDAESARAWIASTDAQSRRRVEAELAILSPGGYP